MKPLFRSIVLTVVAAAIVGWPTSARVVTDEVTPVYGDEIGERCQPGDVPSRQGIICAPAFVEIDGELREEWDYESSHLLNGRKGDAVLSTGCGFIANLLRKVNPEQQYSHAGIMVEDRHRIRHSTASVERILDHLDNGGADGLQETQLRFAWPGAITQWTNEAFDGAFVESPEGTLYELQSFNSTPANCTNLGQLTPDTVLKPPPVIEVTMPETRTRLEIAANLAKSILAHYRFYGYSQPAEVLFSPESPGDWADGTVGSVCSAFVWRALKDANFTLEGSTVEDEDAVFRGAQIDSQTEDGLYVYTASERRAAAQFIYDEIAENVSKKVTGFENLFVTAISDMANQMVNCFGFDWCGGTFSQGAMQAGCDPDDDRAQDSTCWTSPGPGVGRAVSPENMLNWDAAPAGPYGYREDVHYALGGYYRVFRWRVVDGYGTLSGIVTDNGATPANVPVELFGLGILDFTKADGSYLMAGVPNGPATLRACAGDRGAQTPITMPVNGVITQNLTMQAGCPQGVDPGAWRREVRIFGSVKVVDTEDFGSDETDTWPVDVTLTLEPNTEANPNAAEVFWGNFEHCTGGEVRAKVWFNVRLTNNREIELETHARLYEGQSCEDNDLDGSKDKNTLIAEDGSDSVNFLLKSEEFGGDDRMTVLLTVENKIAPLQQQQ